MEDGAQCLRVAGLGRLQQIPVSRRLARRGEVENATEEEEPFAVLTGDQQGRGAFARPGAGQLAQHVLGHAVPGLGQAGHRAAGTAVGRISSLARPAMWRMRESRSAQWTEG